LRDSPLSLERNKRFTSEVVDPGRSTLLRSCWCIQRGSVSGVELILAAPEVIAAHRDSY
jgi:hypothetical protein